MLFRSYYFEHGEFMPEVLKAGKQARHDSTIERPAKKISMTDGYAEAQETETAEQTADASHEDAAASEGAAETEEAGAAAAEKSSEADAADESSAPGTDQTE